MLARIGDKWSVLVVMMLSEGTLRFDALKRSLGSISQRMLTLALRGLERDGLVARTVIPAVPPRVDYELTELGRSLHRPVGAMGSWAMFLVACVAISRAPSSSTSLPASGLGFLE